jgi:quercetin dioxygenase-like cupin family protein
MTEQEVIEQLQDEGFTDIGIFEGGPNQEIEEHTHDKTTVHVMLEGQFTMNEQGKIQVLSAGDRFEVPAGTTHTAKCGPEGCKFVVGVKDDELPPEPLPNIAPLFIG